MLPRLPLHFIGVLASVALLSTNASAQDGTTRESSEAFAWNLYESLSTESTENLLFSPFSISSALAMTYAGARGSTAAEMARTLGYDPDPATVARLFGSTAFLMTKDMNDSEFRIANSLWGQRGYHFLAPFLALLEDEFKAPLRHVDFADSRETSETINSWVAEQTMGHITDLVQPGTIDPLDRLVLVNAVYFKSRWEYPFPASLTHDAPFALSTGDSVSVPTMRQQRRLDYHENETFQMIELPYEAPFSLIVLLPRSIRTPLAIESAEVSVRKWSELKEERQVDLFLPRFEMRNTYRLNDRLAAMGMPDAFGKSADFSGMTDLEPLMITEVAHEAWIDLDELGTEAAAATSVTMSGWGGVESLTPKPPVVFRADHPFLFLIRHRPTHTIVFLGRVSNPIDN